MAQLHLLFMYKTLRKRTHPGDFGSSDVTKSFALICKDDDGATLKYDPSKPMTLSRKRVKYSVSYCGIGANTTLK